MNGYTLYTSRVCKRAFRAIVRPNAHHFLDSFRHFGVDPYADTRGVFK